MARKLIIYPVVLLVLIVAGYLFLFGKPGASAVQYEFGTLTRGTIENTVSATGTLSPVTTVEVGTQVSGTIDKVYVDYNDTVHVGEVLAVLDTLLLKVSVLDAEAQVDRARAQLEEAQADFERGKGLFDRGLISDADFLPQQVALKVQKSNLKSAEVALTRAKRNLDYAVIRSPIDGIVISRAVEAGQTVAASFSTPTLFLIAQDLSHMEILAEVDETDIGQIQVGQKVRFEVSAYSDKEFTGSVRQVRLQPEVISNVVTYTAVVGAPNDSGLLLPGMTATVDFVTESKDDVLLAPSKALRFQPTSEQLAAFQERMRERFASRREGSDSTSAQRRWPPAGFAGMGGSGNGRRSGGMLWYVDSLGQLSGVPVRTGLTDGSNTEIVSSRLATEGMQVIVGVAGTAKTEERQFPGRPPGGFGRPHF
jgi:HlyD family secretion protein